MACRGEIWLGMARQVRLGKSRRGQARFGEAGVARLVGSTARQGGAWQAWCGGTRQGVSG